MTGYAKRNINGIWAVMAVAVTAFCGNVPIRITVIKIIVLTECNPSVLTADKFGKLKKADVSQVKTQQSNSLCLAVNPPPFDKGGKNVVLCDGLH